MSQPFSLTGFNFTKLKQPEMLLDIGNGDSNNILAINDSPLEWCHSLLIMERSKCLPQIMTECSLHKAIELCLLSNSCSLRIAFNSLCGHASVNHLHWHLYYLRHEMLLEYIDVCSYVLGVHLLMNYPAKGLCIKFSSFRNIGDFVSRAFLVVNYLQLRRIAHNVYITRAKLKSNDEMYGDVRIYVWARKSCVGVKDTIAFIPAACEFFGHLSFGDEDIYDNLKEDDVIGILNDFTEESFLLIKDQLRHFLENTKERI
ncbi:GDP-D-glucose phosphorylase 1 isoform X2 [Odontomachus brunneus]|nr:GDP-D-glucose phosphorylase 1 isoform X2 [Odontomachus brunneus]